MNRGIVEWRIIFRGDAVERSLLTGPFRHPDGPRPLECCLISRQSLPTAYRGQVLLCSFTERRVLDVLQDFVSQSATQLTSTLSETRKFNLFAVSLQNVGSVSVPLLGLTA
jgi:hypothetical protein